MPDSLALLPAPPAPGSAGFQHDEAVSRASQKLRGTPRYALATADADLNFPHTAGAFACALGAPITERGTPYLYQLMRRVLTDAALATYGAKNHYNRVRPFVHYNEGTCKPDDEKLLRKDGSYPSGHTSIGWAWALVLAELAPERRDALLARGRAFGESRLARAVQAGIHMLPLSVFQQHGLNYEVSKSDPASLAFVATAPEPLRLSTRSASA